MNRNALIMTAMACLTVIFVCTTWAPAQNADAQATNIGRYQIAVSSYGYTKNNGTDIEKDVVWVIDTATSDTWYRSGHSWRRGDGPK